MRISFLVVCILASLSVLSQDGGSWKKFAIDRSISLRLPDKLDTSTIRDRLLIGKLEYEQVSLVFMKIDVLESVSMAKDLTVLRSNYDKMVKGFLRTSGSVVLEQKEIKQKHFVGRFTKTQLEKEGVEYFIEFIAYSVQEDMYSLQIIYPSSIENESTDLRKRFRNSLIIAPDSGQVLSSSNAGR